MAALNGIKVAKVSCGALHTLVITEDYSLYSFGNGSFGECGHGDLGNLSTPRKIVIAKRPKNGGDILTKGLKNDPK